MGNCQAIDNATLVIQHPSGRAEKLYWPVSAKEIMKMNPGLYVALLLTTTTFCPSSATTSAAGGGNNNPSSCSNNALPAAQNNNPPVRVTRIKLLRPTDNLVLGHVYRLISSQEVMKGIWAKKYAKMQQQKHQFVELGEKQEKQLPQKSCSGFDRSVKRSDVEVSKQVKHERHNRPRTKGTDNSGAAAAKPRAWHPRLHSISEAAS